MVTETVSNLRDESRSKATYQSALHWRVTQPWNRLHVNGMMIVLDGKESSVSRLIFLRCLRYKHAFKVSGDEK